MQRLLAMVARLRISEADDFLDAAGFRDADAHATLQNRAGGLIERRGRERQRVRAAVRRVAAVLRVALPDRNRDYVRAEARIDIGRQLDKAVR